jgi:hypothetical protein
VLCYLGDTHLGKLIESYGLLLFVPGVETCIGGVNSHNIFYSLILRSARYHAKKHVANRAKTSEVNSLNCNDHNAPGIAINLYP